MNCSKQKSKVLHQRRNHLMHQYMLGADRLESSLPENDLVGTKLDVTQQRAPAKADNIVGCIRRSVAGKSRGVILPLCSSLARPHLECWARCWAPQNKGEMNTPGSPMPLKWLEHLSDEERLREPGLPSLEKRRCEGDLVSVWKCLKEGCKEAGSRLCPVVPSDRT